MIQFDYELIIGLAILVTACIVAFKNLKWAFYLVLFLIPLMHKELFSIVMWDVLPIRIALIGIGIASTILFIRWFVKSDADERNRIIYDFVLKDPFLILLLSLLVVRSISVIVFSSNIVSYSLLGFYSLIVFLYFLFKYLLTKYGESFYKQVLKVYMLIGLLTGVFVLVQAYFRVCCRVKIGGVWVIPGFTPRFGSTFWDVNHYGGFLITLIPIFFISIFIVKKFRDKVLLSIGTLFLSVMLFLTQSRSSWIGLVIGLSVSILIFYWSKLRKPLMIIILSGMAALILVFAVTSYKGISLRDKFASYMHHRLDSTDTHVMLLEGASEVFFDNMLLGAGYGGFDPAFRKTETAMDYFDREPRLREMKVPPHSIWGEVLGENGASGIVLYALFAITIVLSLITTIFKSEKQEDKYLGIGLLWSVISIFFAGVFYSYNLEFYWILLFLAIGFTFIKMKPEFNLMTVINWWYGKRITPYLIIIPISLFYIYLKLGTNTLIDYDEAIYAKVAKNIVQTGDWLSLRWEDMDEYWFEKPPLYMWLTALAFKVFNFNSMGARVVSATFGLAGIILVYQFASKMYNKLVGIFTSLILLSTAHYLYYSRNGTLDVTVTFFILGTLFFFYLASLIWNKKDKKNLTLIYLLLSGVFLGLGIMTKAVIGGIPVPIILIYLVYLGFFAKQKIPYLKLFLIPLFGLLVAGPWHIYSIVTHGERFYDKYFIDHIIGRGLSGLGHEQPIWWFFIVIKVSFRIWLVPLALGLITLPFVDKKKRNELILLLISIGFIFIFFSISKDKLLWYIVPIYPFLAILAARFMERFLSYINIFLKSDYQIDNRILRLSGLLGVFLISTFYVVIIRDKVYYSDANKDKVALVKINNDLYPIEDHPDRKLYYSRIESPTLLFYSDHEISSVNEDSMLTKIDQAQPDQNFVFLLPDSMYYKVSKMQDEINTPLVLDVKGSAGEWMLVKSMSRVELLRDEFASLSLEIGPLEKKDRLGTITPVEKLLLENKTSRLDEVAQKLIEYGYSPYAEPPEE